MKKLTATVVPFLLAGLLPITAFSQDTCLNETVIDFEGMPAGTIVTNQLAASGVSLLSVLNANENHPDLAVIFDSANPTGGDPDLGTPNEAHGGQGVGEGLGNTIALNNILIVAEEDDDDDNDGLIDDPDDEAQGGDILFNFIRPTRVKSITFVDTETRGVTITGFTATNSQSFAAEVEALGGNSVQTIDVLSLNPDASARMMINIRESTAIGEIVICPQDEPEFAKVVKVNSSCSKKKLAKKRGRKTLRKMGKRMRRLLSKSGKRKLRRGLCRY